MIRDGDPRDESGGDRREGRNLAQRCARVHEPSCPRHRPKSGLIVRTLLTILVRALRLSGRFSTPEWGPERTNNGPCGVHRKALKLERPTGFEPATSSLGSSERCCRFLLCSTGRSIA